MKTLSFLVALLVTVQLFASETAADPNSMFMTAYVAIQKGELLERQLSLKEAVESYKVAESLLIVLRKDYPEWNKLIVDYRFKRTSDALAKLEPGR